MPTTAQPAISAATVPMTNAATGSMPAGTPLYAASAGAFNAAGATSSSIAIVIGILTADCAAGAIGYPQTAGVVTLTTTQWDDRTGSSGGLTFGVPYYLSATAGMLTTTAPTTVGQFVTLVGVALSTTQLRLLIQPPIGL